MSSKTTIPTIPTQKWEQPESGINECWVTIAPMERIVCFIGRLDDGTRWKISRAELAKARWKFRQAKGPEGNPKARKISVLFQGGNFGIPVEIFLLK